MVEIQSLNKRFGDKILFDNFNLTIQNGEFVVLSGNSGCGKSTLLNMIGSLEGFDSGSIIVDGLDISQKKNQQKYLGEKVGFLFQNFALIEDWTVAENLKLIRTQNRSGVSIDEALDKVGLIDARDMKVYSLSGGEQQRIALARLMLKKCDLLLCDEPTGSLDTANGDKVMSIIDELNKQGKTVILVTHNESHKKSGRRLVEL